jgi:transcription initiation factor TFIID subunit 7
MSADPSQGAFHGLRSRQSGGRENSRSTGLTTPRATGTSSTLPSRTPIPTGLHPLSQDNSPRPQRESKLRHVVFSDDPKYRTRSLSPTIDSSSTIPSEDENGGLDDSNTPAASASMSTTDQPKKLKLSLPKNKVRNPEPAPLPQAQQAVRTPSIKLHVKPSVSTPAPPPSHSPPQSRKKPATGSRATPTSSTAKKRKLPDEDGSEDELARKPAQVRKLTLTTKQPPSQSPITPTLKLKTKGKIPKRPLGLGYDSELDEREPDPTILESFVLRMIPGPDADYVRDAINHGTIGVARSQGGADVQIKFFDRSGRRGILTIRGQRYAGTLVDLPCIVEGMKSWDKKGWVKSADISQLFLVLGKVQSEEEAKEYQLPKDVDSQNWQYAHGLTPPMKWVRKRRYARTKRTSVNAIEAVERKVNQLLADDDLAVHTKFELLDYNPTARETGAYGGGMDEDGQDDGEYDEEEDADGDEVDADDYTGQNGVTNGMIVNTPTVTESQTPLAEEEIVDDFIGAAFEDEDDEPATSEPHRPNLNGLAAPEGDSSIAITSTSPSATGTAAPTPAAADETGAESSPGEDDSDDFDEDGDDSMDDEDREATAQKQKAIDEIQELKEELQKQVTQLKAIQGNPILRRKVVARIEQIEGDLEAARKAAGIDGEGEDGMEDD